MRNVHERRIAAGPEDVGALEDAFDRAEQSLGTGPATPAMWSACARLLRRQARRTASRQGAVSRVEVPADVVALAGLRAPDYSDGFSARVPAGAAIDVDAWHDTVQDLSYPMWISLLMRIRTVLAGALRLRTRSRRGRRLFTPRSRTNDTIVAGEDDRHLDYRAVLRVAAAPDGRYSVLLATVVQRHNAVGRAYFALIRPFHTCVVRSILRRALDQAPPGHSVVA